MRQAAVSLLIAIGLLSPALAQQPARPVVLDVALTADGSLISHCQDDAGQEIGRSILELFRDGERIAAATSYPDGSCTFSDVDPGIYVLQADSWTQFLRVWSKDAAPPAAQTTLAIVVGKGPLVAPPASAAATSSDAPAGTSANVASEQQPEAITPTQDEPVTPESGQASVEDSESAESEATGKDPVLQLAFEDETTAQTQTSLPDPPHTMDALAAPLLTESETAFDPLAAPIAEGEPAQYTPDSPIDSSVTVQVPAPPQSIAPPQAVDPTTRQAPPQAGPVPENPPPPTTLPPPPMPYTSYYAGPTVGDVVMTSIGVAAITVGVVAIHKYDERGERQIVSP